jgi:ribonuclease H2 subunit C
MLAINSTNTDKQVTPNVLPCAIKHNGPVSGEERYWNPSTEQDGTTTSFFRGRKLRGRKIALPEGYEGVVLQKTDKKVIARPSVSVPGDEDPADDLVAPKEIESSIMDQHARFGDIMVWDHEAVPEGTDVYVKGIEEWIGFAEAVCGRSFSLYRLMANHNLIDAFIRRLRLDNTIMSDQSSLTTSNHAIMWPWPSSWPPPWLQRPRLLAGAPRLSRAFAAACSMHSLASHCWSPTCELDIAVACLRLISQPQR